MRPGSENIPPGLFDDQQVEFTFPIFPLTEQRQVIKDLQKQGDKEKILLNHGYKPAFNEKALMQIYENFENYQNYYPFIISYVLNSCISWSILYSPSGDVSKLPLVLRILPKIATITNTQSKDHIIVAITTFISLFSFYLTVIPLQNFQTFIEILRDFFTSGIEDIPNKSYEILVDYIKAVTKSSNKIENSAYSDLLINIGIISEERKRSFPPDIAEVITTLTSTSITQLEISSLSLFSHLAPLLSLDYVQDLLKLVAQNLVKYIKEQPSELRFPKNVAQKRERLPAASSNEVNFQSTTAKTFPEGLNLRQNITLKPKRNIEELISSGSYEIFSVLLSPLSLDKSFKKLLLDPIIKYISENPNEESIPQMCITILMFAMQSQYFDDSILACMTETPVFDGNISIFDEEIEDFATVDCIRNAIVDLIIMMKAYASPTVLSISRTPALFVEFVHRIIRDIEMVSFDNISTIVRFIMSSSLYYQEIDYKKPTEEVERARTSLLLLISHFLSQEGAAVKFLSNTYFSTFFISLIFEDALRDLVLTTIKTYMSNHKLPIHDELMDIILHSMNVCCTNFQSDNYLRITYDVLQTLNEVLKHRRSVTEEFEKLKSSIMPSMSKLSNSDISQKVLLQFIQFFALTSSFKLLDNAQLSALEMCIETVFGHQFPKELWNKLIQLIATDTLPSLNPSFFIRQPDAVKLFLSISMKTDKCIDAIEYINSLVKYSPQNAIECHNYDVDIFVLDTLKEIREEKNSDRTEALLSLFQSITMDVSSSAVVQRFISLFAPIRGKYIPLYHELYMNTLNQIISTSLKLPISYLLMTKDTAVLDVSGLTHASLNDGFSLCFWAYIDSARAQYKPLICQLTDSHNRKLVWYFSGSSLFCTQRGRNYESTGRVEMDDIPTQQWNFFILTYRTDQYMSTMETIINCKLVEPLEFQPMKFNEGPVQCRIGGVLPDSSDTDRYSRLGSFAIFPALENEKSGPLYECGPRALVELPATPLFYFLVSDEYCRVRVQVISKQPEITYSLSNVNVKAPISFLGALVSLCKIEMLIPLFAQFDMRTQEGKQPKNYAKEVLECFGNIFAMSKTAQRSFHWGNGFAIISHLMLSVSKDNIIYSLYKQFFQMMQSISVPEPLDEIFGEILLNIDIWGRCDPEDHIRVLRHWQRNLVPSYKQIVAKIFPFKRALSILRLYYWYTPVEQPQILGFENRLAYKDKLDLTEARRLLQSIALMVSAYRFQLDDFTHLKSHCITCRDVDQVADILWMLLQLGLADPSPLSSIQADFTSFIFTVKMKDNAKVLRMALHIFAVFARKKFTPQQVFEEQILIAMRIIDPSIITPWLLDKVIEILQEGYYELIPVSFVIARHANGIDTLLKNIKPSEEATSSFLFALLPMFVAVVSEDEDTKKILNFYAQCPPSCWESVIETLDFIGNVLNEDLTKEKGMFIRMIAKYAEEDAKAAEIYLKLARFFIFFRDRRESSKLIPKLYKDSPFYVSRLEKQKSVKIQREPSLSDLVGGRSVAISRAQSVSLYNKTSSCVVLRRFNKVRRIGLNAMTEAEFLNKSVKRDVESSVFINKLNFDENGNWIDSDIALSCINLIDKHQITDFISTDILICSYLAHYYPEEVVKHIQLIKLTEESRFLVTPLLHLLNYHLTKCNLTPVPGYSAEKNPELQFQALQKIQIHSDTEIISNNIFLQKKISTIISESFKKMAGIMIDPSDDLRQKSLASVISVIDDIKFHRMQNGRNWMTLWRYLAVDRAPWNYIPGDQAHFKRDNTACALWCPFKLKRNLRFDPHNKRMQNNVGTVVNPLLEMALPTQTTDLDIHPIDPYDPVYYEYNCTVLAPHQERSAQFLITKKHVKLIFADKKKFYRLRDIIYLFFRRRNHRPNSIEIFFSSGKSYFICFPGQNSLEILSKMAELPMPNIKTLQTRDFFSFFQQSKMTERWLNNRVSNFEYIMHLNIMSGRTFNDISQYPILPWVTTNFIERFIDFKDASNFRDLSKPVGALGEERLKELKSKLQDLKDIGQEGYLYNSGPSGLIEVCMYLFRLEPFATMHTNFQKGEFAHPGRLFCSIYDTFSQVTNNAGDYRELIPEFFFMPEFLVNHNGFDLGSTERIGKIGDVLLPPWSQNPMDFVYMNRKMLESPLVTQNLHKWIDLIWGVNQRGEGAEEADNLFMPEMYDKIWNKKYCKSKEEQIDGILEYVGQIPPVLFKEPHPQRIPELEPRLTFTDPCKVIAPCNENVMMARIEYTSSMVVKVGMYEPSGLFVWCKIDISQHVSSITSAATRVTIPRRRAPQPSSSSRFIPGSLPARFGRAMPSSFCSSGDREMKPHRIPHSESYELGIIDSEYVQITSKQLRDITDLDIRNVASSMTTLTSRFATISNATGRVVLLDTKSGQIEELVALHNDAVCLASDRSFIAIALQDSAVCVFKDPDFSKPMRVMPSYRDSIICCGVSASFYLVVMGTRDGSIIVNSLNKGGTVRVVDLEKCRPRLVTITHGWGFIVVYMTKMVEGSEQHILSVFNVNGELIKSVQLDNGIVAWDTWVSASGFDYMVIADTRGRLFAFEVYYANPGPSFFRCWNSVVAVKYLRDVSTVVAVTSAGKILFVPHTIK